MNPTFIFATSNPHKVSEVQAIAGDHLRILSLSEANCAEVMLQETADSLFGNAQQKARILYDYLGLDCFAEDTGLEVDALQGAPGVYTSRYAGGDADASKNISKLLRELEGEVHRTARFRTVFALIMQKALYFFEGTVEGTIAEHPSGDAGFGYDPVFIPKGFDQTFAELPPEIKNTLSHRSNALNKMMAFLRSGNQR